MLRHGGGRRVRERDHIARGVDAKDVGVGVGEEAWDGRALQRRIQELQQGGAIKLFMVCTDRQQRCLTGPRTYHLLLILFIRTIGI